MEYYATNAEHLGNYVYAGRYRNGNESSGDGYKYRGRGLIQTTLKSNNRTFNTEHNSRFPDDPRDFVENPDLILSNVDYGVESAFVYWDVTRSVNVVADLGTVRAVTKQVNGGENDYAERKQAYNRIAPILNIDLATD